MVGSESAPRTNTEVVEIADYLEETLADLRAMMFEVQAKESAMSVRLAVIRAADSRAVKDAAREFSDVRQTAPYPDARDAPRRTCRCSSTVRRLSELRLRSRVPKSARRRSSSSGSLASTSPTTDRSCSIGFAEFVLDPLRRASDPRPTRADLPRRDRRARVTLNGRPTARAASSWVGSRTWESPSSRRRVNALAWAARRR